MPIPPTGSSPTNHLQPSSPKTPGWLAWIVKLAQAVSRAFASLKKTGEQQDHNSHEMTVIRAPTSQGSSSVKLKDPKDKPVVVGKPVTTNEPGKEQPLLGRPDPFNQDTSPGPYGQNQWLYDRPQEEPVSLPQAQPVSLPETSIVDATALPDEIYRVIPDMKNCMTKQEFEGLIDKIKQWGGSEKDINKDTPTFGHYLRSVDQRFKNLHGKDIRTLYEMLHVGDTSREYKPREITERETKLGKALHKALPKFMDEKTLTMCAGHIDRCFQAYTTHQNPAGFFQQLETIDVFKTLSNQEANALLNTLRNFKTE